MRSYDCYIYYKSQSGNLKEIGNNACFAGVSPHVNKTIYIDRFQDKETLKNLNVLLKEINRITPCKVVKLEGKILISFKMLDTYDKSLVLLNFIRNLWHSPIKNYSSNFLDSLKKSKLKDPLERLTEANIKAIPENQIMSMGHSNIHKKSKLKIKNKEFLLKQYKNSTLEYLT